MRTVTVGQFDRWSFGLSAARHRAVEIIEEAPTETIFREASDILSPETVEEAFERYVLSKSQLRSVREIERIFRRDILPALGHRAPESITRSEVTSLIDAIVRPSAARAAAAQLSAFYSWLMPRSDLIGVNPCRSAGKPNRSPSRDRVLSDCELKALWKVVSKEPPPFGPGLQLLMLTLQRRAEVFDASCSEFNLRESLWVIPSSRTKNARAHELPLSSMAKEILVRHISHDKAGKLFPARGNPSRSASGFSVAMDRIRANVDAHLGFAAERFTMHDVRRTGATAMQRLGIRVEVTEAVLNHVSGTRGGIVGVYQRYAYADEKIEALNRWADELRRIIS